MPEIEEEVVFSVTADKVVFHTMTNGDTLVVNNIVFTKEQAATLSWLINHSAETELKIKVKLKRV